MNLPHFTNAVKEKTMLRAMSPGPVHPAKNALSGGRRTHPGKRPSAPARRLSFAAGYSHKAAAGLRPRAHLCGACQAAVRCAPIVKNGEKNCFNTSIIFA